MNRILVISIFLFSLFSSAYAWADNYFFVTLEYPPLEYKGKDGKAQGASVEIVTQIMMNLGHSVEIRVLDWTRALKMVKEGGADAIFTAYKNPERETFLDYSQHVFVPQIVCFYAKRGHNISFEGDFDKLKGNKIGVVSTISYGHKFDQARSRLYVETADKLEYNYRKLLEGSIDLVISNSFMAEKTLNQLKLTDEIVRLPQEIERVPSYIAFSKKRALSTLRDQFDRELIKFKTSGEYFRVMRKYGINIQSIK